MASLARSIPPSRNVPLMGLYAIDSASYEPSREDAIPLLTMFPPASNSATFANAPELNSNQVIMYRPVAELNAMSDIVTRPP